MRLMICGAALLALAACQPRVPDSGAGVGFQDYDTYQAQRSARDAELQGSRRTTIQGPAQVYSTPLDPGEETGRLSAQPLYAGQTNPAVAGTQTAAASTPAEVPRSVENAVGISDENNFDAVSSERSIEGDAARIARNRAQYQVIEPTALPNRVGSSQSNVVDFALRTSHPVGRERYSRSIFASDSKAARACAAYTSNDLAQADFLARGGPERDRLGLDPDGDGYACGWDPAPFRLVRSAGN